MKTLLCFGDSMVFGYGVPRSKCWVSLLNGYQGTVTANSGVCGETTLDMLPRFRRRISTNHPDALIIMAGTNDFFFLEDRLAETENRLMYFVREAQGAGIRTFLSTITPYLPPLLLDIGDSSANMPRAIAMREELNDWIRTLPECINCAEAIESRPRNEWPALIADGVHLTAGGHALLAQYLRESSLFPDSLRRDRS